MGPLTSLNHIRKHKNNLRIIAALITALITALALMALPTQPVRAAVNNQIQISNLRLIKSDVNGNDGSGVLRVDDAAKLSFAWDASTAKPQNGDSFFIDLPDEFKNLANVTIPLTVPRGNAEVGTCNAVDKRIECTFNEQVDELRQQGFDQIKGGVSALLKVLAATNANTVKFNVNGTDVNVALPEGRIDPRAVAGYNAVKMTKVAGVLGATSKAINWEINFGSDYIAQQLNAAGQPITIDGNTRSTITFTDTLGPGQQFFTGPADFKLMLRNSAAEPTMTGALLTDSSGKDHTNKYGDFDLEATTNGNVATFKVTGPFATQTNYKVYYPVRPTTTSGVIQPGFKYTNEATLDGTTASARFERYFSDSFAATVNLEPGFGGIDITKLSGGPGANNIAPGTNFTIRARYTLPAGSTTDTYPNWTAPGTVNADKTGGEVEFPIVVGKKTVYGGTFPKDTQVQLSEDPNTANPTPLGVTWGAPEFKQGNRVSDMVTIADQKSSSLMLTNTANLGSGKFQVKKVATGTADAVNKDYRFNYTCNNAPDNTTGVITARGDGTPVESNEELPAGTECTVTEDPASAAIDGHDLTAPAPVTVTILDKAQPIATAEVTNTYARSLSTFEVRKTVNGAPGADQRDYKFTYSCGAADPKIEGEVTVKGDGQPVRVNNTIPVGETCLVTEDNPTAQIEGYSLEDVAPKIVTIQPTNEPIASVEFVNTYTQQLGTFSVKKLVEGAPATATNKDYQFTYTCGTETGDVTAKGDGQAVEANKQFPVGTKCTLRENPDSANIDGFTLQAPSEAEFTIDRADAPVEVEVRNVYAVKKNTFQVKKTATGAPELSTKDYKFTYTCGAATGEVTAKGDGQPVAATEQFPVGTECTVTEDAETAKVTGFDLNAPAPVKLTIAENTATAEFENTYTEQQGNFKIIKVVSDENNVGAATKEFTLKYTCTKDGSPAINGEVKITGAGEATSQSMAPGYECAVTEEGAEIAGASLVKEISAPVTISNTEVKNVTVTNTYTKDLGRFKITKQVTDPDNVAAGKTFSFSYTCTQDGSPAITGKLGPIAAGGEATSEEIPAGASCVITENDAQVDGADLTTLGLNAVTIVKGETTSVSVENRYSARVGSVEVSKTLAGNAKDNPALAGKEFEVDYVCTKDGAEVKKATVKVVAGTPARIDAVPVGASCAFTEKQADVDGLVFDAGASTTTGNATVAAKDAVERVALTNAYDTKPADAEIGSIEVTKTLVGNAKDNAALAAKEFEVDYVCTKDGAEVKKDTLKVAAGASVTVDAVPVGALCAFAEKQANVDGLVFDAGASTTTGNATVAAKDAVERVALTNAYNTKPADAEIGSIEVTKTLAGNAKDNAALAAKEFEVGYVCTKDGAEVKKATVKVVAGTPVRVDAVPVGALCAFAEKQAEVDGLVFDAGASTTTGTVTVAKDAVERVALTNAYNPKPADAETGSVEVTKTLAGNAKDNPALAAKEFEVDYVCTKDGAEVKKATVKVVAGTPARIDAVPVGASCAFTEKQADVDGLVFDAAASITTGNATVAAKDAVERVALTNAYDTKPADAEVGSIEVTKTLAGNAKDNAALAAKEFEVGYVCTKDGAEVKKATVKVTQAAPVRIDSIPVGAACEFTEKQAEVEGLVFDAAASTTSGNATVAAKDAVERVALTNAYNAKPVDPETGSVEVTKTLAGNAKDNAALAAKEFEVDYVCTKDGAEVKKDTLKVAAGASVTVDAVPVGALCAFAEKQAEVDGLVFDAAASTTAGNATVATKDAVERVALTNAYNTKPADPETGTLTVTKKLQGTGAEKAKDTTFNFEASWSATAGVAAGNLSFSLKGGEAFSEFPTLPVGTKVTVKETAPQNSETVTWAAPTFEGADAEGVATVTAAGTAVTVVNTATSVDEEIAGLSPLVGLGLLGGAALLVPLLSGGSSAGGSSVGALLPIVPSAAPTPGAPSASPSATSQPGAPAPTTQPLPVDGSREKGVSQGLKGAPTAPAAPSTDVLGSKGQVKQEKNGALASTGASVVGVLLTALLLLLGGFGVIAWATARGRSNK